MALTVNIGPVFIVLVTFYRATKSQEGAEVPPVLGNPPPPPIETPPNNATGQFVVVPPVPLAFTYPGALPVPGISWPMLGGIGYIAEGRYPYNGYVGSRSPHLALINRRYQQPSYSQSQLSQSYNNNQYGSNYNNNYNNNNNNNYIYNNQNQQSYSQPQISQGYGYQNGGNYNNNQYNSNRNYISHR